MVPSLWDDEDRFTSAYSELHIGSSRKLTLSGVGLLDYPIAIGEQKFASSEVLDTNDVITPLGTFTNCVHVKTNGGTHEMTFSNGVGIVTRRYTDGTFWELIDYEVK